MQVETDIVAAPPPADRERPLAQLVRTLRRHWQLTWEMARRDIADRYAGQVLGLFWAVGHPLLLMAVYLFIFGYVFKVRVGGTRAMPLDYTVYLLSGIIPWLAIQEGLNRGSVAITNNVNLVKQVVFPLEVLPVKMVLAALPTQAVSFAILITYVLVTHHGLPLSYALLPVVVFLQIALATGIGFLLSAVGVFFRDLKDVVLVLTTIGVYMLPVFYLPSMVPTVFRPLLYANPFSYVIWCYQDVCYFGRFEHPWAWPVFAVFALASLEAGCRLFARLKPTFGNVL